MYYRVSSRALVVFIAVLQLANTMLAFYITGSSLVLVLLIPPLLTLKLRDRVYLVSLGHAIILSFLGDPSHLLLHVVSACMVVLAVFTQLSTSEPARFTSSIIIPLLMLAPTYIATPYLILYPAVSLLALLALATRAYLKLSKCTSLVVKTRLTTHVGDVVEIPVEIKCPNSFKYSVLIDGKVHVSGISSSAVTALVKVCSYTLGTVRKVLKITISDPKEVAKIEHGPFTVEVLTTPKFTEILYRAEEFIKKYVAYLGLPLVLKGSLEPGRPSFSLGATGVRGTYGSPHGMGEPFSSVPIGHYYSLSDKGSSGGFIPVHTDVLLKSTSLPNVYFKEIYHKLALEVPVRVRWYIPLRVVEKVLERAKSYVGEYMGVRDYQPGDSPRTIHWKKSLRAPDRENLVVKLYGVDTLEKSGGGRSLVIIADLVTPSLRELDLMLHTVYSLLLETAKSHDNATVKTYVYLILPRGRVYLIQGKVVDVLLALNTILVEEGVKALYDYEPYSRIRPPGEPPKGFLEALDAYFNGVGEALTKDLIDRGVPRHTTVYLVFSRALTYKYTAVARVLERLGYSIGIPTID